MPQDVGARRFVGVRGLSSWGPALVLLLAWLLLWAPLSRFLNPDGVSYATLASDWADGRYADAVNGYWSPLLPMLGAPLVALGVPSVPALRLILLASALLIPAIVADLTRRAGGGTGGGRLAAWATVPFLLGASLFGVYPDLLFVLLALSFLRWAMDPRLLVPGPARWWVAAAAGLTGGAAYLAKAVGLPLVLSLAVLAVGWQLWSAGRGPGGGSGSRRHVLASWAVVLGCVAAVSLPWVAAISVRSGGPTISTAGGWNAELVAAGSRGNPMDFPGFYPPGRPEAVSAWIDPAKIPVDAPVGGSVTTTGSASDGLRAENTLTQLRAVARVLASGWLVPVVLAAAGLVLTARQSRSRALGVQVGLIVAASVLTAGLSLVIIISRYLWFAELALLPVAVVGLCALTSRRPRLRAGLAVLLVLSVAAAPVRNLAIRAGGDPQLHDAVSALRSDGGLSGGLSGGLAGAGDWSKSQSLCFELSCQYVGMVPLDLALPDLTDALRQAGARHLVVWTDANLSAELPDRTAARVRGGGLLYTLTDDGLRPGAD